MAVHIIDTNVLVTASGRSSMPPGCALHTAKFLRNLQLSDDLVAVDQQRTILREYKDAVDEQDLAYEVIRQFHAQNRFDFRSIVLDEHGDAILSSECLVNDRDDRKFVAVALAHEARPPIHNASDTDWLNEEIRLKACGVQIVHHCEETLRDILARKSR